MFDPDLFLDTFVALFAVLNPLLAVSVFLSLTADQSPGERQRVAAVYPLAIPLIAGPGSFVTTIVMSSRVGSLGDFLTLSAGIAANALVLWLSLVFAVQFARIFGQTVVSIGTPLLAILLAAIAIELVFTGIDAHVRGLVSTMQR